MLDDDMKQAHETLYSPEHLSPVENENGQSPLMMMNKVDAAGLVNESFTFY